MNTESGNVKIISKEMIKPSSATPLNLRNLKLSFLDQLVPPFYVPVIFFYKPNSDDHRAQISQQLKQSFSESLTLFYPLAGRLDADSFSVDCNDAGAEFIEARVHSLLSAAVEDPRMAELEKYLPADPKTLISASAAAPPLPLLSVQVNFFDCGGIAIGVCSSHQVTDAVSLVAFLGSWAAANRGEKQLSPPASFHLARLFPARDVSAAGFSSSVYRKKETLVTKRFIFDKEKLSALKQLAATSPPPSETTVVDDPTRVEVVSAFIWKHFIEMSAAQYNSKNPNTISALWHVVNLRTRIKTQQISDNVVGNCILKKFFVPDDPETSFHDLVRKLRTGIREIDEEYIWELAEIKGDHGKNNYLNDISKSFDLVVNGEMEACGFSSWCRFPVYEVDYGWGTPEWVCPTSCPEKNVTFLMSTKDGDGVEAWMNILESTVEILDNKFKLIGTSST